ncbi:MAG: hypothetical protein JXA21_15045 [Anaerolineae bacterium]|nr:hypothetical protein [Anaerolineae bacterium]
MKRYIQRMWADIRQGQNVDVYLTILVCTALIVLDIFNLVNDMNDLASGVLAALLLMALSTLNTRHVDQRLGQVLDQFQHSQRSSEFFGHWDMNAVKPHLKGAQEISLVLTGGFEFINSNADQLKVFVERGGLLRCILMDPDGEVIPMAMERLYGDKHKPEYLISQINLCIQKLKEIAISAAKPECVQVAVADYLLEFTLTAVDSQSPEGIMFVTLNGFGHSPGARPTFILHREEDAKWFSFYNANVENLWTWSKLKRIDLSL